MSTCGYVCVCVYMVMWAGEGDIMNDIFVDRSGVAVLLNLALDYSLNSSASRMSQIPSKANYCLISERATILWSSPKEKRKKEKTPTKQDKNPPYFIFLFCQKVPPTVGQASVCAGTQIKRLSWHRRGVHVQSLFCPPQQWFLINYLLRLL